MQDTPILKPFSGTFLSDFVWTPQTLPFTSEEIANLDKELSIFEQIFLNPDVEKNLISKNELLASFAISKAENSQLTLAEAQNVYNLILSDPSYDFIAEKLKAKKKLTNKDYDQLEFFNILRTFRNVNNGSVTINNLTSQKIRNLHASLTTGLDIFSKNLSGFTVYKSGSWRDNDLIRVGNYIPAPCVLIDKGVDELIKFIKQNQSISGVAIFHAALYGLHPFNNGNKRTCRILEHLLLRSLGMNSKNLYSTSYYYHKQKERYYKYLLFTLERKNLNHYVSFMQEGLVFSIIDVVKTSLESKRQDFIRNQNLEGQMDLILKPFIKRGEWQFKNLARINRKKVARQTLITYLQKAVDIKILIKRESGRSTYYKLNFETSESETLQKWLLFIKGKLNFIPDDIATV